MEPLKRRREKAFKKFALKTERNECFREAWLEETNKNGRNLRTQEKYKIKKSKFDRLKNGPLNRMREILNEL